MSAESYVRTGTFGELSRGAVIVLESGHARSDGVLEYCALSELHPASAGVGGAFSIPRFWRPKTRAKFLSPLPHLQPRGRRMQFGPRAILPHSKNTPTPLARIRGRGGERSPRRSRSSKKIGALYWTNLSPSVFTRGRVTRRGEQPL